MLEPITRDDSLTAIIFDDMSEGVKDLIHRTKAWHRVMRSDEGHEFVVALVFDERRITRLLTDRVRIVQDYDFQGTVVDTWFTADIGSQSYLIDEVIRLYEVTQDHANLEVDILGVRDYLLNKNNRKGLDADLIIRPRYTATDRLILPTRRVSSVMADTGMAKSLFLSNVLVANRKRTLLINSEMDGMLYLERLLRIHTGYSEQGLLELYQRPGFESEMAKVFDWLTMHHKHITFDKLSTMIEYSQPEIVVLDTYDGILTPGLDEYSRDTFLSKSLIDLARDHECAIVLVFHINKQGMIGGNEGRMLFLSDIKGATHLPQKCYQVLAIEGDRHSPYRTVRTVKNREGVYVHEHLHADWASGRFYPVTNANSNDWSWPAGRPWARNSIKDIFNHEDLHTANRQ